MIRKLMTRRKRVKLARRAKRFETVEVEIPAVVESEIVYQIDEKKGGAAILIFDADSVEEVVLEDDPMYEDLCPDDKCVPVIIPSDMTASELVRALNAGEKRMLKTTISLNGMDHRKISKR